MHFDCSLVIFQKFQFLIELFFPIFLDTFEGIIVEIFGSSESMKLMFFFILLNFSSMHDDESMLVLCIELSENLHLLLTDLYFFQSFLKDKLYYLQAFLLYL